MLDGRLPLVACSSALGFLGLIEFLAFLRAGTFEYPLDDVYIHLALADSLARGEYGVSPGQLASAGSSPLYPLLLLPVVPAEFQRLLPALWNLVGVSAAAFLWGRLLELCDLGRKDVLALGLLLAASGPIVLNMPGVAALGMEHTLHAAAAMATLVGLMSLAKGRPEWALLFFGAALAPLLRFEGLAFSLAAAGALGLAGERRRAAWLAVLVTLPLFAFCALLTFKGIGPLPNSVLAKAVAGLPDDRPDGLALYFSRAMMNLHLPQAQFLAALTLAVLLFLCFRRGLPRVVRLVLAALVAALIAHLLLGGFGWAARYEHYAMVLAMAGLVVATTYPAEQARNVSVSLLLCAPMIMLAVLYAVPALVFLPASAAALRGQQFEMQRLAKEYLDEPVAVNDIGWVAWRNPHGVVDLWGLATPEALRARLAPAAPGWAVPLVESSDVRLAMLYEDRLQDAIGDRWVPLGELRVTGDLGYLAEPAVTFFATDPGHVGALVRAIEGWTPGLTGLSEFRFAGGVK